MILAGLISRTATLSSGWWSTFPGGTHPRDCFEEFDVYYIFPPPRLDLALLTSGLS